MPDPIEHIIVLMLENRSFDQMLGILPNVDGIDLAVPGENICDGKTFKQASTTKNIVWQDPKHLHPNVKFQVEDRNGNFVKDYWCEYSRRKEFVQRQRTGLRDGELDLQSIMDYFADDHLYALHRLAKEYTVCDRWFSSVPGPTWPNRFFAHSGTSLGFNCMPELPWELGHLHWYNQPTIYSQLAGKGNSWKIYYQDIPQSLALVDLWKYSGSYFGHIEEFMADARRPAREFPDYCFIEPRYGYGYGIAGRTMDLFLRMMKWPYRGVGRRFRPDRKKPPNDDHPPHNVNEGQALIARLFNALTQNQELWRSSLLVILYDEHGGFYDHHPLVKATPPGADKLEVLSYKYPCGGSEMMAFGFDKSGVRVPAVLVSPWVKRAHVSSTHYDHTSVLRYVCDKWGIEPFTHRIDSANSISDCLNDDESVNQDAPSMIEIRGVEHSLQYVEDVVGRPLNDNQQALVILSRSLDPEGRGQEFANAGIRERRQAEERNLAPFDQWSIATERVEQFIRSPRRG